MFSIFGIELISLENLVASCCDNSSSIERLFAKAEFTVKAAAVDYKWLELQLELHQSS